MFRELMDECWSGKLEASPGNFEYPQYVGFVGASSGLKYTKEGSSKLSLINGESYIFEFDNYSDLYVCRGFCES
ncbi:hypothetical protein Q3G72_016684 [Acer saccharum]|nr:hypothetical protein Q3G72_016684 [Acer saccharum]